jgi:hypothetical protein
MIAGLVWPLVFVAAFLLAPDQVFAFLAFPILLVLVLVVAMLLFPRLLLSLSRCSRCSRALFRDELRVLATPADPHGIDYRARAFLGSYAADAMLQMARTGSVRCMRCGYQLGESGERAMLGPEE